MTIKGFLDSPVYSKLAVALAALLAAFVVFWAGAAVGYREALFSHEWDDSYALQFTGPHSPFVFSMDSDDAYNSHGAFGQIVALRMPEFTVKGPTEAEKNILVGSTTVIRYFHSEASSTSLIPGETVVVIGEPDGRGRIQASFIRIVPVAYATGTPGRFGQ